ncbi:hypothetical protein BB737_28870, partial [Mycobacterium avium subsp. hominissuis]
MSGQPDAAPTGDVAAVGLPGQAELRALLVVVAGSAVVGALLGALWAWIAPP